jgi:hypothetical protein
MKPVKRILLVEDDPKDVELTLTALGEHKLANDIEVVRDGVGLGDGLGGWWRPFIFLFLDLC